MHYDIPHIFVTLEQKQTLAALDTGSSVTAISLSKFNELRQNRHLPMYPSNKSIKTANAESFSPTGYTTLRIQLNDKQRQVQVDIIPNFMFDFLIGWPQLRAWGAILNAQKNIATIANEIFPFHRTSQRPFRHPKIKAMISLESLRIPASSAMKIRSRIDDFDKEVVGGIVLTDTKLTEQAALFIAKGVPIVDGNGNTEVLLANQSSEEYVFVPKNTQIGHLANQEEYTILENNDICSSLAQLTDDPQDEILRQIQQWTSTSSTTPSTPLTELDLTNTVLDEEELLKLKTVLSHLSDRFVTNSLRPGRTTMVEMDINTGDSQPVNQAPYPRGPAQREFIEKTIEENLEGDIIRPSYSPWASPVCIIRKKDGYFRFAIDYRKLNAVTKRNLPYAQSR